MDSTPFSKKCEILANVWTDFSKDGWADFFTTYNLGFPLAFCQDKGLSEITADGAMYVDQTWQALCEELRITPNAKYDSVNDLLDSMHE